MEITGQAKDLLNGAVRLGLDEQELIRTAEAVIAALFGGDESEMLLAVAEAMYYVSQGGVSAVASGDKPISASARLVMEKLT